MTEKGTDAFPGHERMIAYVASAVLGMRTGVFKTAEVSCV